MVSIPKLKTLHVFAVYDCCRVMLKNLPGLSDEEYVPLNNHNTNEFKRGVGDEENGVIEGTNCRYIHIQACKPGGLADADAGFARRIFEHAKSQSEIYPR